MTEPRTKAGKALLHEMADIMGVAPGLYVLRMIREVEAEAAAPIDVERNEAGEPRTFWWCGEWGTLNAIRYHGNEGPDGPNCGKVAYYRVAEAKP